MELKICKKEFLDSISERTEILKIKHKGMECNNQIYLQIEDLTKEQKIVFGLSCINRTINMYKCFGRVIDPDSQEDMSIFFSQRHKALIPVLEYIENKEYTKKVTSQYIRELDNLIVDDEDYNSVECVISQYIITGTIAILEFIENNDNERIFWCSDCLIEILNQGKLDEIYRKYTNISDEEIEEKLESFFESEVQLESEIIQMIKNQIGKSTFDKFILNNQISYNPI